MPYLCFHHKLYHKMFAVDHCGVPTLLRWSHFLLQPVNMVYFINSLSFLRTIFISLRCAGPLLQRADLPAQRLLFVRGAGSGAGFSLFVQGVGFSLFVRGAGSGAGFSRACSAWTSQPWRPDLVVLGRVGSSQTRNCTWPGVPCVGRWILNQGTTGKSY